MFITLKYDTNIWHEQIIQPVNTLQLFITNRCQLRCKGCFYEYGLGNKEMSIEEYCSYLDQYNGQYKKIILLGGEPLLHSNLSEILEINSNRNIRTTIYTNGRALDKLNGINSNNFELRIGVYGVHDSEKALSKVGKTDRPVKIVYMLRKDNIHELMLASKYAEENFNCSGFYISSIRDIIVSGSFWDDTKETVTNKEYATYAQNFLDNYTGNIKKLEIATRGILNTDLQDFSQVTHCRFGNVFTNGNKIMCPFDIGPKILAPQLSFGTRRCNKHSRCILQKISLIRM